MTPNEYQQLALRTESRECPYTGQPFNSVERIEHAQLGLASEGGEVADVIKRHRFYGTVDLADPAVELNLMEEAGDHLWYVAILLDALGVPLEQCMAANINKLASRYPDKFSATNAANRDLDAEAKALKDGSK